MLRSATNDGIKALEDAKLAQVSTTARSFNARVESSLGSLGGLGARPWELTEGSEADQAVLDTFALDPEARSGSFLVDDQDTITAACCSGPASSAAPTTRRGGPRPRPTLLTQAAAVLPVTDEGVTTDLPSYAFAVAIPGETPGTLRGALHLRGRADRGLARSTRRSRRWRPTTTPRPPGGSSTATGS